MNEKEIELSNDKQKRKRGNPNLVKGVSGNPAGKPKGTRSFSTIAREALIKLGMSEEVLVEAHLRQAMEDPNIRKDVFDRIYGKAMQPTDLTTGGEKIILQDLSGLSARELEEQRANLL